MPAVSAVCVTPTRLTPSDSAAAKASALSVRDMMGICLLLVEVPTGGAVPAPAPCAQGVMSMMRTLGFRCFPDRGSKVTQAPRLHAAYAAAMMRTRSVIRVVWVAFLLVVGAPAIGRAQARAVSGAPSESAMLTQLATQDTPRQSSPGPGPSH